MNTFGTGGGTGADSNSMNIEGSKNDLEFEILFE